MKRLTITALVAGVALVCCAEVVPVCGAAQGGKRMGYCFDAAFHEKTSRLFVAGGDQGTHVFQVTDGKLDFITTVADGGYHRNLKIAGDRVYLADAERGLVVFDITGREPIRTWQQGGASGLGLDVRGKYAYLAAGGDGLHIFDISTPDAPEFMGKCKTNADAWDVWVNGPYAYVADLQKGITVVDISQPAQPQAGPSVTWDETEPMAEIIRGEGKIVCIGAGKHGLVVADISNPQAPKIVSRYKSGDGSFGEGLCIKDGLVYLANGNGDNRNENGLIVVDVSNPQALKIRGKCTFAGWVEGVCLAGHQAFVTNTQAGVRSIDVRDPDQPRLTDSFGPGRGDGRDPLLTAPVSPQEIKAIEEFRRIKAQILAGESYRDTSTPLHAALAQFSAWGPGNTRDYFTGLAIFRAPLPPAQPEEGSIWPIFAGSGEVEDTFLVTHSKGQWIWIGNMGNPGDWRPAQPEMEKYARQEIARRAAAVAPAQPEASAPPTAGAPGTNRALELDGRTSFVRVADAPSLHTFTNAITIETWFMAASFDTQENMINSLIRKNVASGEENFLLRFRTLEGETCVQMSPGYDIGALSASYPFATGKWYHLAGVYDGDTITAYVNGTPIGSMSASGRMGIDQSDLFLGKGDPEFAGGEYFHGALDETRLWNVARSQKEIQATMNTTLTGKEKGLVAYWSFDDGTARDLSGHGLDGLPPGTTGSAGPATGENTPGKFPQLAFHIWGSVPFSSNLTRKPLNQHILLAIRKDPRSIEEIAREVEASSEEASDALAQLAKYDLVRQAGESRWVANVPVFVKEEILKAHEIGVRYARIQADLLRDNIPALKTAYEQCQVSRYHPWSKTSLIVVGALCADFCVSDRIRFRSDYCDERFLPPRHPDGRRWGYSGEEVLNTPLPSRKYQFYQNVVSDAKGGMTRFGYYHLLDEKRMSPPRGPGRSEDKIWLSLTTPATLEEIRERTGLSPDTIKAALDNMSTWSPPGVVEENGQYMPGIPILSADDLARLLPEADRVAEIIFKQVTIPMENEMEEESQRLGLRFPLPSGTSARDIALQILSEEGVIAPIPQPPVPWNFGVWGWNGRLAMWEDVQ